MHQDAWYLYLVNCGCNQPTEDTISCCGPTYWREAKQEASSKPLQRCRFVVEIADESQSNEYIHEAKEKIGK